MAELNGEIIRKTLLQTIEEYSKMEPHHFQSQSILKSVARQLDIRDNLEMEQVLLTLWDDLFRQGLMSWGYDIGNDRPPFCHLTKEGRKALEHFSRDPANPDGYMAYLKSNATLNLIAEPYLKEALQAYNSNCYKAAAVMIGCAAESIALDLAKTLVNRINILSRSPSKDLSNWKIKKVLDRIETEINSQKHNMDKSLEETYEYFWSAFVHQIRFSRNDAGHPNAIDQITQERVHASLLIFPELSKLNKELTNWVNTKYQ